MYKYLIITFFVLIAFQSIHGQSDDVYQDMSLEELFDVEVVVSASKKPEDLFEAPLSVTIIKRQDIINAGATSLPEALRLAPGLIIREQTPGNYDIHIRGFDEATQSFILPTPTNSIMLVMIDNRVVYNYFAGGTFWETLPIDISDIERIEVVRGPASALYGPNAAAGVINFITNKPEKNGTNIHTNTYFGSNNTKTTNGYLGYKWNDRAVFGLSGNYSYMHRFDRDYFAWKDQKYLPLQDMSTLFYYGENPETGQPHKLYETDDTPHFNVNRALDKYGLNFYFDYNLAFDTKTELAAGYQLAKNQKVYYNNFSTPLSDYRSQSRYLDFKVRHKNLYGQISAIDGVHDNNFFWNSYLFQTFDGILEYNLQFKGLNIRPGLSHRRALYSGHLISDEIMTPLNNLKDLAKRRLCTSAFSVLADYHPTTKIRLISGFRADKYNIYNKLSLTYETALTYRFNKTNLGRIVFSKANRAPFMLDSYIGKQVGVLVWVDIGEGFPGLLRFLPNRDVNYLSNYTFETGWRYKPTFKIELDVELFSSLLDDLIEMRTTGVGIDSTTYPGTVFVDYKTFRNSESQQAWQNGLCFSLGYKLNQKLKTRLYGMIQHTEKMIDRSVIEEEIKVSYSALGQQPTRAELDSLVDAWSDTSTPTPKFFGGFVIQYNPKQYMHFNINAYFMSSQTYRGVNVVDNYSQKIPGYLLLNAKTTFDLTKAVSIHGSVRNILGKHREYGFSDKLDRLYLLGFTLNPS
ncbi:TonB-dependent receptor [candidate division KSB1 bacterium]|nr:TonB-dependent receptor [candidate division KSB1 bacterium]